MRRWARRVAAAASLAMLGSGAAARTAAAVGEEGYGDGCADTITTPDGERLELVGFDELEESFWVVTWWNEWLFPPLLIEFERVMTIGFYRTGGQIVAIQCGVEYRLAA